MSIEAKLKSNEYEQFRDYLEDMEMFQNYLFENSPLGPGRHAIILQHLNKYLEEASEYFLKAMEQELEIQSTLKVEMQKKLSTQLDEVREELLREKNNLLKKV